MTDVPPPDSPDPKPPRGRPRPQPRRPRGLEGVEELSNEEVARRVDVRGGGTPRGPIERAPVRERRIPPPPRRERTGARDSLLLIGLVIVGLVAVRLFLPDGPLTASATATPGATQAAVATGTQPAPPTAAPTGGLITLPPTPFVPTPEPTPIPEPTPTPLPTPTPKPGQTPAPTPKPTKTPAPTPSHTPGPTPPAGTAFVNVTILVIKDDGGNAVATDWTINATSDGTATPSSFTGSRTVTVTAGKAYNVAPGAGPSGYATTRSAGCSSSSGLTAGTTVSCQISKNDIKPTVTVTTIVDGGTQAPSDWSVSVSGTDVVPDAFSGTSGGRDVSLNANATFSVSMTNANDQDYTLDKSGTCSGTLSEGASVSCTFTYTYVPPPTGGILPVIVPLAPLPFLVPRRWRPTRAD